MDVREKSSNGKRLIDVDEAIINFGFEWDDIPPTREEFVHFLKKQPAADAAPVRHGRWLSWDELHGGNTRAKNVLGVFCSECIR